MSRLLQHENTVILILIQICSTLHIFGAINFLSIPLVWALYPETANRTLEEMDLLFASNSPFVWNEEKHFKKLKAELEAGKHIADVVDTDGSPIASNGDVQEILDDTPEKE